MTPDNAFTDDTSVLAGPRLPNRDPLPPFSESACSFLSALGKELSQSVSREQADLMTFAFWCREANLRKLREGYPERDQRLGHGLTYHVTPANMPVAFAFSFAFGLLAGNANLVRVPTPNFPQVVSFCVAFAKIMARPEYAQLREMNTFIRHSPSERIAKAYSDIADARLLWGGDASVDSIRSLSSTPKADLFFRSKYSMSVINADLVASLVAEELERLARLFFDDTFAVDQAACSSPSFIAWLGAKAEDAQKRFWPAVQRLVDGSFTAHLFHASENFSRFCQEAAATDRIHVKNERGIYRVQVSPGAAGDSCLNARYGYFYESRVTDLAEIVPAISDKCQTLTYYGVERRELLDLVIHNRLRGIDRIVPFGTALSMGLYWDGYDIIRSLSRFIDVQ